MEGRQRSEFAQAYQSNQGILSFWNKAPQSPQLRFILISFGKFHSASEGIALMTVRAYYEYKNTYMADMIQPNVP